MKSPGTELDKTDPGDDVGLRFQYQYCYAAINATRLVTNEAEISAVICENHEDILIERPSGAFVAIQVKTRELDQPPFRSGDEQVQNALERFCRLDACFPDAFQCFEFVTNHSFWEGEENSKNLPWVLAKLKERGHAKGLRSNNPVRKLVNGLRERTGLEIDAIAGTLVRTNVSGNKSTLRSIVKDVEGAVSECADLNQHPYCAVVRVAKALKTLAADASAKVLDGPVSDRYAPGSSFATVIEDQQLAGKRIERADVMRIIQEHTEQEHTFETLNISGLVPLEQLPHGLERMILKMARGGLQRIRIEEMQNLVYAFQALFMRWVSKHGSETAGNRYEDLLARVRFDCVEARVAAQDLGDPYGRAMFEAILTRLRERWENETDSLYGCRPEHLLGAAGLVTENCNAWWSSEFEVEVEEET